MIFLKRADSLPDLPFHQLPYVLSEWVRHLPIYSVPTPGCTRCHSLCKQLLLIALDDNGAVPYFPRIHKYPCSSILTRNVTCHDPQTVKVDSEEDRYGPGPHIQSCVWEPENRNAELINVNYLTG